MKNLILLVLIGMFSSLQTEAQISQKTIDTIGAIYNVELEKDSSITIEANDIILIAKESSNYVYFFAIPKKRVNQLSKKDLLKLMETHYGKMAQINVSDNDFVISANICKNKFSSRDVKESIESIREIRNYIDK